MSDASRPIPEWPRVRVLPLEGGRNFRDLGGYATDDGRQVKWGVLFRSGSLINLTPADWDHLSLRGVRALCDFRSTRERESEPFLRSGLPAASYWFRDYSMSFADLRETMRAPFATEEDARRGMMSGYRGLPFEQSSAYRQLFAHLKAKELPVIFNCSAGKDRTGTAAGLVLWALGVPRATVIEDFVLTNQVLNLQTILRRPSSQLAKAAPGVVAAIGRADPAYLQAAFESIEERHGGIEGYLREVLDISAGDLEQIKATLLEPSSA